MKQAPKKHAENKESEIDSDAEATDATRRQELEIIDVGGGIAADVEDEEDDTHIKDWSVSPSENHDEVLSMALQKDTIDKRSNRMGREQKELRGLHAVYNPMLRQNAPKPADAPNAEMGHVR